MTTPTVGRVGGGAGPAARRRRFGQALTVMGAVGMVLTLVAAIVAFVLVGSLHESIDQSLAVTVDALDTIDGTLTVSREVVDSVADALDAVGATVSTLGESTGAVTGTLDALHGFVGTTLPTAIDGIQNALPTIKTVAGTIDAALDGVSRIPFGPNYQPTVPFADTIQQLIDSLAPLDTDLSSLGTNLAGLQTAVEGIGGNLDAIELALSGMRTDVDSAKAELDRYAAVTADAREVAASARDDLQRDVTWMRVLVVIVALALLTTQALTVFVGRLAVDEQGGPAQWAANASSPAASAEPPPFGRLPRSDP